MKNFGSFETSQWQHTHGFESLGLSLATKATDISIHLEFTVYNILWMEEILHQLVTIGNYETQ